MSMFCESHGSKGTNQDIVMQVVLMDRSSWNRFSTGAGSRLPSPPFVLKFTAHVDLFLGLLRTLVKIQDIRLCRFNIDKFS